MSTELEPSSPEVPINRKSLNVISSVSSWHKLQLLGTEYQIEVCLGESDECKSCQKFPTHYGGDGARSGKYRAYDLSEPLGPGPQRLAGPDPAGPGTGATANLDPHDGSSDADPYSPSLSCQNGPARWAATAPSPQAPGPSVAGT